jgi:hypothetical protein
MRYQLLFQCRSELAVSFTQLKGDIMTDHIIEETLLSILIDLAKSWDKENKTGINNYFSTGK